MISLLIEIFIFNINYFTKGYKNTTVSDVTTENLEILDNGYYLIEDDEASVLLKDINQFVGQLEFNTDSFGKNVNIKVEYNDKIIIDNINTNDMKSININESVDSIKILFTDEKGKEIRVDDFKSVNDFQFNYLRFFITLLCFVLLGIISYTIINRKNLKLEIMFLILVICFGFFFTIMTPVFYSWDEEEHFVKAYNLASFNLVMREGESISYPSNIEGFLNKKYVIDHPNYRSFEEYEDVTGELLKLDYADNQVAYYPSTAITYTPAPYLFSAFGVLLGKILCQIFGFPFLISFYLGRFFNVLIYAILGSLAIKLIPTGKRLLFMCALLPTIVFQAASFSADVVINGFSFLVFAIIIKWLFDKKRLTKFDLAIICTCFILITASKVAYAPIFLLILIFKNENFADKKRERIIKLSVLLLGVLTAMAVFIYGNRMGIAQWVIPGVNVKEQLLSVIHNPINFIWVIIKTFLLNKDTLLAGSTISLAYAGYLEKNMLIIMIIALGLIAFMDAEQNSVGLKMRDRGIILFMCLATIGLSMLAMYLTFTPVNYDQILGFQGRYLIPLIFPLLFLLQRRKTNTNASTFIKSEVVNMIAVIISICFLFYAIMFIYSLFYI